MVAFIAVCVLVGGLLAWLAYVSIESGWVGTLAIIVCIGVFLYAAATSQARPVPPVGHTSAVTRQQPHGLLSLVISSKPAMRYMPAPPRVQYVRGTMPGDARASEYALTTDAQRGIVYYTGKQPLTGFEKGHETGHVFDAEVLTDGDRHFFQRLMHAPSGAWNAGSGYEGGTSSPAEWFADYYGAAATHVNPHHTSIASYADIGPKRLARFEAALTRLGQRRGLLAYR